MNFKPINCSKVSPLKSKRTTYFAEIEAGTDEEDLLKPEYWADVANRLRDRNHIEAEWTDGTKLVSLRVIGVGMDYAKVHKIASYDFTKAAVATSDLSQFIVEHKGDTRKWSIIRKSNKRYVKYGFDGEDDATNYLKEHIAEMAA